MKRSPELLTDLFSDYLGKDPQTCLGLQDWKAESTMLVLLGVGNPPAYFSQVDIRVIQHPYVSSKGTHRRGSEEG